MNIELKPREWLLALWANGTFTVEAEDAPCWQAIAPPAMIRAVAALPMEATIKELRASLAAAEENECARWQGRFEFLHSDFDVDGGFCDSGDPLDFTESEVRQVISKLTDRAEAAEAKLAEALKQVQYERAQCADAETIALERGACINALRSSLEEILREVGTSTLANKIATLALHRSHATALGDHANWSDLPAGYYLLRKKWDAADSRFDAAVLTPAAVALLGDLGVCECALSRPLRECVEALGREAQEVKP